MIKITTKLGIEGNLAIYNILSTKPLELIIISGKDWMLSPNDFPICSHQFIQYGSGSSRQCSKARKLKAHKIERKK